MDLPLRTINHHYMNLITVIALWHIFFSHRISLGILASRRTGFFVPPYGARKTAASNIVDPRLVTVNKKRTGDPNQSSRLCVFNDVVIGFSVHSWATRCTPLPRAPCYTRTSYGPHRLSRTLSLLLFWQWLRSFVDTETASSPVRSRARACLTAL